jgi:hypothetical protein
LAFVGKFYERMPIALSPAPSGIHNALLEKSNRSKLIPDAGSSEECPFNDPRQQRGNF